MTLAPPTKSSRRSPVPDNEPTVTSNVVPLAADTLVMLPVAVPLVASANEAALIL